MRRFRSDHRGEIARVIELTALALVIGVSLVGPVLPARAQTTHTIEMYDYYFVPTPPAVMTINAGDHVVWHNNGAAEHTAQSNTSAWTTVSVSPTQTSSPITLNTPGTYTYICNLHYPIENMWGIIEVQGTAVPEFSSTAMAVVGMLVIVIGLMVVGRIRK